MLHQQSHHPSGGSVENLNRKMEQYLTGGIKGVSLSRPESHPYDRMGESCRAVLGSQPFDTALRADSGRAVDPQEATSEPGIRVAEYCPAISQWHLLL